MVGWEELVSCSPGPTGCSQRAGTPGMHFSDAMAPCTKQDALWAPQPRVEKELEIRASVKTEACPRGWGAEARLHREASEEPCQACWGRLVWLTFPISC